MIRVDLETAAGAKVVRLEVRRAEVAERYKLDKCAHLSISVDPLLATVECTDCHAQLNPVEWIAMLTEYWECVDRITAKLQVARAALDQQAAALELQRRAKCQHCGRITSVRLASSATLKRRLKAAEILYD